MPTHPTAPVQNFDSIFKQPRQFGTVIAIDKHVFAFSRRDAPELCQESFAQEEEGAGNAGCALHPRSHVPNCAKETHMSIQVQSEALRHSPRNGFTAYIALSPATNSSCHRHRRIKGLVAPGWADENLRRLDTSNGCQDHAVLPYASASSSCARDIAHGTNPPCAIGLTPTLPRPPHPVPTFVTMANAPPRDRTAGLLVLICPTAKANYFCKGDWTGFC